MANSYSWQFGFDFDAAPDAANDGLPYLQSGFVQHMSNGDVLADPEDVIEGDSISFAAFNITAGSPTSGYSIDAGESRITFRAAELNQEATSPFDDPSGHLLESPPISPTEQSPTTSVIFSPGRTPDTFRWWTLGETRTAVNTGSFTFVVILEVDGPSGSKRFRVDPEMIVEAGPPRASSDA